MSISIYFVDLSNASCSFDTSYGEEHTSTLTFDALVTYPKDELTPDGIDLGARRWRLAIYDQASSPGLDKPNGSTGILRWGKDYPDNKKIGCIAQCEVKATMFSRLLSFLQAGNKISSAEISIDTNSSSTTEKGTTASIIILSLNADCFAAHAGSNTA